MTPSIYPEAPGDPVARATVRHERVPADRPDGPAGRAWLEVDLDAVRRNAERLGRAAGVPLVAMVKADGYGLGAERVARALGAPFKDASRPARGLLWALGVATLDEARALREAGCVARILCTSPILQEEHGAALDLDVRPALHRAADIEAWTARGGAPWHLAIDTGMSRAGVRWDEAGALRDTLRRHAPEGAFTHFHSAERADGSRETQEARFAEALASLQEVLPANVLLHCDNSASIAARHDAGSRSPGDLARPGIGLYGAFVASRLGLEATIALRARVIDVRDVLGGERVSYGGTWTATGTRRVATVGVGHGDGYRQAFSNRGECLLNGVPVPVVGLVTMDMTMLDVTGVPCEVGDVVTMIGGDAERAHADARAVDAVAASGAISPYELLVGMALRVPRRYRGGVE